MTAPAIPLLTYTRRRILSVIREYYTANGYAPSIREIGDQVGLSVSAVQHQLVQLERMGWIRRDPNRPRALVVLDPATGRE